MMKSVTIALLVSIPVLAEPAADVPVEQPAAPETQVQPAPEQPALVAEEPAVQPAPEQPAPVAEEPAVQPEPEQPAPAEEDPAVQPEPEQPAPAVEEPAVQPEPEQPAPAEEDPAVQPEPEQPAPVAEEPAAPQQAQQAGDINDVYRGIVKIEVAVHKYDYATPWRTGAYGTGNGTGFLVGPGVFMTNAHVVANAERIYVSPYADARKYKARVLHVAHDADLALVEVQDAAAFADIKPLEFSDSLPHLEDTVRAIGYPIGGNRLSVTRGIVSRIDTTAYAHPRNTSHLTVQVDAAINPGNSGGPVLMGDKVVGVVFQGLMEANSTGYMIPAPVIQRFLKDVEDGRYDGYVELGADFLTLTNPGMRRHFGLADGAPGTLVGEVMRGGSCDGVLQAGDLVVSVNGHEVDSSAMIELDGERVLLKELAERSFKGDKITFGIVRKGEPMEVTASLAPQERLRITGAEYDTMPRYVEFAGLVFQPLQMDVIQAHRFDRSMFAVELWDYLVRGDSAEKEDIVVVTKVLSDEVNARYGNYGRRIVTKVNGEEVKGLSHLYSLLYPQDGRPRPEYTVIEFADAPYPLVIDNADIDAANARISAGYNIPVPARLK